MGNGPNEICTVSKARGVAAPPAARGVGRTLLTETRESNGLAVAVSASEPIQTGDSRERLALLKPRFQYDDGGRAAAGFKGDAGDCVCRAIAIATGTPYRAIYDALNVAAQGEPRRGRSSAREGVSKRLCRIFLKVSGWTWHPTMQIGSGCKVHLRAEELPSGVLIVAVSRHYTTVIDGVIHDTHDPSRDGNRCVYGYYTKGAV